MADINDGGPAFPCEVYTDPNGDVDYGRSGMTRRQYLVAHAPPMPPPNDHGLHVERTEARQLEQRVAWAFAWADAVIAHESSSKAGG